jgi:hypothetical protein
VIFTARIFLRQNPGAKKYKKNFTLSRQSVYCMLDNNELAGLFRSACSLRRGPGFPSLRMFLAERVGQNNHFQSEPFFPEKKWCHTCS